MSKQVYGNSRPNVVIGYSNIPGPQAMNLAQPLDSMVPESMNGGSVRPMSTKSTHKSSHSHENIVQQTSQEFLKDVPKPQWERFQDFNDVESSGDEEDVFFYTDNTKEEPKSALDYQ